MIDTSKYIKIPYRDRGRSFDGCDCFGLAILVYREEWDRKIADVFYPSAEDQEAVARLIDVSAPTINAEQTERPIEGDLILMREGGQPSHIGIYIDGGICLHTSRRFGTCCERIDGPRLKSKIMGYYRVA